MADDDKMDVSEVLNLLQRALPLQMRSILQMTWIAGGATGIGFQSVADKIEGFARQELDDSRHLIEKMTALGGTATAEVADLEQIPSTEEGLQRLIAQETEVLEALHAVIPATGQEARSEALEHLLEHMIMRKQHQLDFFLRVARPTST